MPEQDWKQRLSDDVEIAIGISVDCGGTRGVHRVRDVVLKSIAPHIQAAYHRGLMAGRSQAGYRERLGGPRLTSRELEIARLAAEGLTNKEIGQRLFLSADTVRTHMRSALKKTGARTRGHLAVLLAVNGQVNIPNPRENKACPAPAPSAGSPSRASTTRASGT